VDKAKVDKAKIKENKINKAENKINKVKDKADKAKEIVNNNTVAESVANKVVTDIIVVTKLRLTIKTPPNTTKDID
jgi:hypothetical protein